MGLLILITLALAIFYFVKFHDPARYEKWWAMESDFDDAWEFNPRTTCGYLLTTVLTIILFLITCGEDLPSPVNILIIIGILVGFFMLKRKEKGDGHGT